MTPEEEREIFQRRFLLGAVAIVSIVFLMMVRQFLVSIFVAAILTGLFQPVFVWAQAKLKGRTTLAALTTVLVVFLLIVVPVTGFFGLVAAQALDVVDSVGPWIDRQLDRPDPIAELTGRLPFSEHFPALQRVFPGREQVFEKLGEAVTFAGTFLVNSVASITRGTVNVVLQLFIILYAMFYFLLDGTSLLDRIRHYVPLSNEDEDVLVGRFLSVSRATLKGSLVIGVLQGALAGIAFAIAGIGGAAFWATVMMVLSVIPGVGAALVWIPAVVYLVVIGEIGSAIGLAVWCAIVVGTIDNFLRPRLVGRDAKMSDLMILLSTLGGIFLFGAVGFVIGPIVAALFVTVWELYGRTFDDILPKPRGS